MPSALSKRFLIIGGTGSLGTALTRRLLATDNTIIIFSRDEAKHFRHRNEFRLAAAGRIHYFIGDVRNYDSLVACLNRHRPDVIISAAAMKQVPLCEEFPTEAVATNVIGAQNVAKACAEYAATRSCRIKVLSVSTDKAVKSVNAYGATKALQEKIHLSYPDLSYEAAVFNCVRYGNVLESTGSVVPVFQKLLRAKQKLTITDSRMTRFLLSLDEAVDLIFAAVEDNQGGKIFVPRVRSAYISDLAKVMLMDQGIPSDKVSDHIEYTGIRPGEKLHEILISEEECHRVHLHDDYFTIQKFGFPLVKQLTEQDFASGSRKNLLKVGALYKYLTKEKVVREQTSAQKAARA